jgi:drug/metabolite transporter (DMT)-like permease
MKHKKLWFIVVVLELINAALSYFLGDWAANTCPRPFGPTLTSLILSLASLGAVVVFTVTAGKARKWRQVTGGVLVFVAVVCMGYALLFLASGGIDWCDYHF